MTKSVFCVYIYTMGYTPPKYPAAIPSQTGETPDLPDRIDDLDWLYAARYNELKKELCAALAELGVLPKGSYADVAARLAAIPNPAAPADGDIIIRSGGVWARLAKGDNGQVLTLVDGLPAWTAPGGGGFEFRTGDLLFSTNLEVPAGFADISTTYNNYFIRISNAGELGTGGSDTHSHSLIEANLPSHSHGYGTLAASEESAHTHAVGSLAVGNEAAHTHAAGSFSAASDGAHTHSYNTPQYEVEPCLDTPADSSSSWQKTSATTGSSGAHAHEITGSSAAGSSHTHSLSGATAAGSSHTHTISGSTAAVGSGSSFSGDNVPVWLGVRCYQKV